MGYQRARWHSGLTYQQVCETCKNTVTYTDYNLDYRPWYADGYVDCPTCGTHLRHNENYALPNIGNPNIGNPNIGNPNIGNPNIGNPNGGMAKENVQRERFPSLFCHNCGAKFGEGHRFCAYCGMKRD